MAFEQIQSTFRGKKVLITGNTGFKGSWLSMFLHHMGAELYGFALDEPADTDLYPPAFSKNMLSQHFSDIRDPEAIARVVKEVKPDHIFHLAAQSILLRAYQDTLATFETNTMGTVHLLEAVKRSGHACNVVIITSDKSYRNNSWVWGYRETDVLGSTDPYGASKAMAELAIQAYHSSFFSQSSGIRIASCRAGNVFGGGDWNMYRIIPDCMRRWYNKESLLIRNPQHIRPWNYVLDVIWGYILTAYHLQQGNIGGEAFNFGPPAYNCIPVEELVKELWQHWPDKGFDPYILSQKEENNAKEHAILRLNCDKAHSYLDWKPLYHLHEGLQKTAEWYASARSVSNSELSLAFIGEYVKRLS